MLNSILILVQIGICGLAFASLPPRQSNIFAPTPASLSKLLARPELLSAQLMKSMNFDFVPHQTAGSKELVLVTGEGSEAICESAESQTNRPFQFWCLRAHLLPKTFIPRELFSATYELWIARHLIHANPNFTRFVYTGPGALEGLQRAFPAGTPRLEQLNPWPVKNGGQWYNWLEGLSFNWPLRVAKFFWTEADSLPPTLPKFQIELPLNTALLFLDWHQYELVKLSQALQEKAVASLFFSSAITKLGDNANPGLFWQTQQAQAALSKPAIQVGQLPYILNHLARKEAKSQKFYWFDVDLFLFLDKESANPQKERLVLALWMDQIQQNLAKKKAP